MSTQSRFVGASLGAWLAGATRGEAVTIGAVVALWKWLLAAIVILLIIGTLTPRTGEKDSGASPLALARRTEQVDAPLASASTTLPSAATGSNPLVSEAELDAASHAGNSDPAWVGQAEQELTQAAETLHEHQDLERSPSAR